MIATSLCYENGQKSKGKIEDIHDAQMGIIVCINKQPGPRGSLHSVEVWISSIY